MANVSKEAVAEELLPYKELFTLVLPGKDHKAAATSYFVFISAGHSCYDEFKSKPD